MFKITEGDFKNNTYGDESYLSNWPMLYILENGKQAYIGESNHVKNRMSQHRGSVDKRIFDKVHFIYSSKFNHSVTLDYESKLIQYIVADEELKEYIQHVYYVLLTRGIRGTYLYVCDPELRKYISKFVDIV